MAKRSWSSGRLWKAPPAAPTDVLGFGLVATVTAGLGLGFAATGWGFGLGLLVLRRTRVLPAMTWLGLLMPLMAIRRCIETP